jgi:hypothetical protein
MNAKSSMDAMPLEQERKRERAGEHVLFNARTRSKLAKQGGDALSDLAHRDVDRVGRYPAPAEMGTGGELVPAEPDLRDTVKNPDYVTVDASRDRLALASGAGVLELALDASDTIDPKNSLEKMLAHQMAVLHRQMMRLSTRMEDLSIVRSDGFQQRNVEVCRLAGTVARLALAYQSGFLDVPAAARSLRSSMCMSVTVARRLLRQRSGARVVGGDTEPGRGDRGMANGPHALSLSARLELMWWTAPAPGDESP